MDAAPGLGPARPGGSPAAGRGSPRAAPAPGRCPRPPGRGVEGFRRAGPGIARRGRVDPRPAPLPRALARPGAILVVAGRGRTRRGGPPARRADARHDRPGSLPDRHVAGPAGRTGGAPRRHRRARRGPAAEPPPFLVAGPAGDLPPGAGGARRGRGRLRPVHGPLARVRLGLFQPRLRARPGRGQGRGDPRLHGRPGAGPRPRRRPTSTAGWPGWN